MDSFKLKEPMANVQKRQAKVPKDYIKHAQDIDRKYNADRYEEGGQGPVEAEIVKVYEEAKGLVIGPYGDVSTNVNTLMDLIARHKGRLMTEGMDAGTRMKTMNWIRKTNRQRLGLLIHREWADLLIAKVNIIRTM